MVEIRDVGFTGFQCGCTVRRDLSVERHPVKGITYCVRHLKYDFMDNILELKAKIIALEERNTVLFTTWIELDTKLSALKAILK